MEIIFKSNIIKYNKRGVGFIYLLKEHQNKFNIGQQLKVTIKLPNNNIIFFAKLRSHHKEGIYVPASVANKNNLLDRKVPIVLVKIDGFFTKLSYDGRIYLPQKDAIELKLKQNEIILVKGIIDKKSYKEFCQVKIRRKSSTTEYFCMFNPKLRHKEGVFSIESILSRNRYNISKKLADAIKDFNYAFVDENNMVMYYGNRVPIVIRTNFDLKEIAHYLGCYFADGTKRGVDWGICASTFEQARYYLKLHDHLIRDHKIVPNISFTDTKDEETETLKKRLTNKWKEEVDLEIEEKRTRVIHSDCGYSRKTNPFGSLVLKEHRQLSQIYYNKLLKYLFDYIKKNNDSKLALDFILGTLEGDGSVGVRSGHLMIHSNLRELEILSEIMKYTKFQFRARKEGGNKGVIFIGSLEIIKNMPFLKDKIFQYYPKRRKLLQERLFNTGCAQFLLKGTKTSNTVIGKLKENGILDSDNELTKYGKEVQASLREFIERV